MLLKMALYCNNSITLDANQGMNNQWLVHMMIGLIWIFYVECAL